MAGKVALVLGFALLVFLQHAAGQTVHVVGDATGWTIPQNGAAFYRSWAAGKNFKVGDSLVFNFTTDVHDVVRVQRRSYDVCSDDDEIGDTMETGPATIVLSAVGEHNFICTKDRHCDQGQKLAINVSAAAPRPATPPSSNAPPPPSGRAPVTHVVGDAAGWAVPQGGPAFYANWTAGKTFVVGDSLVFNFTTDVHDVERVPRRSFDICSDDDEIGDTMESGPATVVLTSPGEHCYICTKDRHCDQGQKLAINVSAAAPGPATPPSSNPPPPPPRPASVTHVVGDATGWTVPPGGAAFYTKWAHGKTFAVGDSLVFNFTTDVHDVERVPKRSFDICSDEDEIGDTMESGPATVVLTSPGKHYYICTKDRHCQQGQKLAINVLATRPATPPPSSNGPRTPITTPPSSAPTPGGSPSGGSGSGGPQTISPPGSSSAHAVVAALSVTLFGLVLSLF